ncbi:MAG: MmgE/PrpD family protein [Deltaproteobacteria bacterium]|nr:MmgE/PrpD family protein [Deltaproteobacteria bacterium]
MSPTKTLATYAANLSYGEIPPSVTERMIDCVLDSLGAAIYGVSLPWSRTLIGYARRYGAGGNSSIFGPSEKKVQAPFAALANGGLIHSFELDNVRQPGAGVHAGATLVPAGFAAAEELGATGDKLLSALVAGCEVMFRIGHACRETSEKLGFHAPGLTGPLGAAATAGHLFGLNPDQMVHAFGIAASLASGILAFAKSATGGMVKRLHLGRAAEGGVLAATLARDGFTGPEGILEGDFGFLHVFSREPDLARLTHALGEEYEVMKICMKRFPCHITAQAPIQAVQELRAKDPFPAEEVAEITIAGAEKMITHHNIGFAGESFADPAILSLCRKVRLVVDEASRKLEGYLGARVTIRLHNGQELTREVKSFKGSPADPLSRAEVAEKFFTLTAAMGREAAEKLFQRVERLAEEKNVGSLLT